MESGVFDPNKYKCLTTYLGYPQETAQAAIIDVLKNIPSPQDFLQKIDELYQEEQYKHSNGNYGFLYRFTEKPDRTDFHASVSMQDKVNVLEVLSTVEKNTLRKFMNLIYRNHDGRLAKILPLFAGKDKEFIRLWIEKILFIESLEGDGYNRFLGCILDTYTIHENYSGLQKFHSVLLSLDSEKIKAFIDVLGDFRSYDKDDTIIRDVYVDFRSVFKHLVQLEPMGIKNIVEICSGLSYEEAKIIFTYFSFRSSYLSYVANLDLESGLELCKKILEIEKINNHAANWVLHYLANLAREKFTPETLDAAIQEREQNNKKSLFNNDISSRSE